MNLSPETLARIDALVPQFPRPRSAALPLLHLVQEEVGYIPEEAIEWIAQRLGLTPINILELVTFYPVFRRKPAGRCHLRVCRTLSCALQGSYPVLETLRRELQCPEGSVSPDGAFSVEFVECLASCGTGPAVLVGDDLHERVDPAKAAELAQRLRAQAGSGGTDPATNPAADSSH